MSNQENRSNQSEIEDIVVSSSEYEIRQYTTSQIRDMQD